MNTTVIPDVLNSKNAAPFDSWDSRENPGLSLMEQVMYTRKERNVASKESDPTGKSNSDPGAKMDAGKNQVGMVMQGFHRALTHVSRVGTKGAAKYSKFGFLSVSDGQARYTDAMMRHWFKECTGEEYDLVDENGNPGTEELHAACVAWNALARLEFILMEKEND